MKKNESTCWEGESFLESVEETSLREPVSGLMKLLRSKVVALLWAEETLGTRGRNRLHPSVREDWDSCV